MTPRTFVVIGAFATQFVIVGSLFGLGLYVKVFEAEFGWTRTLVSSAVSLSYLVMGASAIALGRLSDRIGPRRVLLFTGVLFGIGLMLLSQISQPWHFFAIMGSFVALGLGAHDVVTLSTIAHWFDKKRGIMTAVAKVGTASGQMALPLMVAALIVGVGWRATFLYLGAFAIVTLVLAAMLMSNPHQAEASTKAKGQDVTGLDFAASRRTSTLRKLWVIQFLFYLTLMTVPLHLAAHGIDLGLTTAQAASLLSVVGGASVAGRLVVGLLIDRIGVRNALSFCLLVLAIALAGYAVTTGTTVLFIVTAIYGFTHGALFVVISPTVAYFFGMKAHGQIFGTVLFFGTFGSAIGPIAAGAAFDTFGSYLLAFSAMSILAAIALGLARTLPKIPETDI